jgi:hypothetical protein
MRRLLFLLAVPLAAGVLSACSGTDGAKAESLLQQAEQAQQNLTSERFVLKLGIDIDGRHAEVDFSGGGYVRGERAGDFYVTATGSVPGETQTLDLVVVRQGSQVRLRMNGQTQTLPVAQAQTRLGSIGSFATFTDLARYVKDVSVSSVDYLGRPADKVVGTLDSGALLGQLGGVPSSMFSQVGVKTGDLRVVLYVPRDSHLVEAMTGDFTLSAGGRSARVGMTLGMTGIDQPVDFPSV